VDGCVGGVNVGVMDGGLYGWAEIAHSSQPTTSTSLNQPTTLNHTQPTNHTQPHSTTLNHTQPHSTTLNHTQPHSTTLHTQPHSTTLNHTQPHSTTLNHTQPHSLQPGTSNTGVIAMHAALVPTTTKVRPLLHHWTAGLLGSGACTALYRCAVLVCT